MSDEWKEVFEALGQLYTPDEADTWMRLPNKMLGNKRPWASPPRDVLRLLHQLLDGSYV